MKGSRQSLRQESARPALVAIPTHVVMGAEDPELVASWPRLGAELRRGGIAEDGDHVQQNGADRWRYLCSTPFRAGDGTISYLHIFRHGRHPASDEALTAAVPASDAWWPSTQRSLDLGRTWKTGRLRLVS